MSLHTRLHIRRGTAEDAEACQQLTRTYRQWFPFVMRASLIEAAERGELLIAEVDGMFAGFVSYRTRRDGWHTVYEIAVAPEFCGEGVGRNLLYAVPTPIKLKCPVDNEASNRFYERAGMMLETVVSGKRPLNVWTMRVLCVHVQGGNRRVPEWARSAGMAYGTRHDATPYEHVFMLDINWRKYIWPEYMARVLLWRPVMAMVADYEHPAQRETMLQQVADLRAAGVLRILVCPKFHGAIKDIPADCIVAISVPSQYAGFMPEVAEVGNRPVHLLGGVPYKLQQCATRYNVISADYSAHEFAAQRGTVWDGRWVSGPDIVERDVLIPISGANIRRMLNRAAEYEQAVLL